MRKDLWHSPGLPPLPALCLAALAMTLVPGAAFPAWDVREMLGEGLRVKVEGRTRGGGLYEADQVTFKGDREGDMTVEGLLEGIDPSGAAVDVSGISLRIRPGVEVLAADGRAIPLDELGIGGRVIVALDGDPRTREAGSIRAVSSRDKDVEIKGPIERIVVDGGGRMDLYLLGERFQCDETTVFFDPDGDPVEINYAALDVYRRLVDSDDRRPANQIGFGDLLTIGGEVQEDIIPERNLDLDDDQESNINYSKLSALLEFTSRPHPDFDLFLKIAASEPTGPSDPSHPARNAGDLRTAEAYVLSRQVFTPRLGLKVGRQAFDEKREWLYRENLDAVRLFLNFQPVVVELSAGTNLTAPSRSTDDGVVNYILYGYYGLLGDGQVAAYVIHREDDDPIVNYDRRWYGLRSFGDIGKSLSYWIDLSLLRGERRGRRLRSNAFDVGFTHILNKVVFEPSFTFGYAYGSGDDDYRDNIDGNYRQTDFENNNDKFNGVSSFKYYGEVLDPELSNLRIATAGAGFRWARDGSFDIVYHSYSQVVPNDGIHGSDLLSDPLGRSNSLGDEIDLIWGYEKLWNVDLELDVGFFRPGIAFSPLIRTASRTRLQVEFNF